MLEYRIIRSKKRKKTISLLINRQGEVVIHAPIRTPVHDIDVFFRKKLPWLEKKLRDRDTSETQAKRFVSGEEFLYLGELYPLLYSYKNGKRQSLELINGSFVINTDKKDICQRLFIKWYRKRASEIINERLGFYSKMLNLFPSGTKITGALYRHGSCSGKNSLSFSWRLMMAPIPVIDYVIIHELCHIKEKNHSEGFWGLVEKAMPDYRKHKKWLKDKGRLFNL